MLTKPKSDGRVKRYVPVMIPEPMHKMIKKLATAQGLRINQYTPRLINMALEIDKRNAKSK